MSIIIEIGKKYGKLTVLENYGIVKHRNRWLCLCECGNKKAYPANNITRNQSCGCSSWRGK